MLQALLSSVEVAALKPLWEGFHVFKGLRVEGIWGFDGQVDSLRRLARVVGEAGVA